MRTSIWSTSAIASRIGGLLILILILGTCLPPASPPTDIAPAQPVEDARTADGWKASFQHVGLGQPGTITASARRCRMTLAGSVPATIILDQLIDQPIDPTRRLQIYVGWPRNAQGQITGVLNQSRDPPWVRIQENKLGPTIVWAMSGCRQVCVKGIVLQYVVAIIHGSNTIPVTQIDTPTANGCAQPNACLAPTFHTAPSTNTRFYAGAIDQPGCTIAAMGDGFWDTAGQSYTVAAEDQVDITFKQRALILCDRDVIGVTDWGYRLTAKLGATADQITPSIREAVAVDLFLKDDPNLIKRARFAEALVAAQKVLLLPER